MERTENFSFLFVKLRMYLFCIITLLCSSQLVCKENVNRKRTRGLGYFILRWQHVRCTWFLFRRIAGPCHGRQGQQQQGMDSPFAATRPLLSAYLQEPQYFLHADNRINKISKASCSLSITFPTHKTVNEISIYFQEISCAFIPLWYNK